MRPWLPGGSCCSLAYFLLNAFRSSSYCSILLWIGGAAFVRSTFGSVGNGAGAGATLGVGVFALGFSFSRFLNWAAGTRGAGAMNPVRCASSAAMLSSRRRSDTGVVVVRVRLADFARFRSPPPAFDARAVRSLDWRCCFPNPR